MAKTKRAIAKSAAVTKNIEAALTSLGIACAAGDNAVARRGKDGKTLAATTKRLSKKRATLARRKKLSAKRAKAAPSGETKKALRAVIKELATTKKQLLKARAEKAVNAVELAALKVAQRRATAYAKAITQATGRSARRKPSTTGPRQTGSRRVAHATQRVPRRIAWSASRISVRSRMTARLSCIFRPRPTPSVTFTRPLLK